MKTPCVCRARSISATYLPRPVRKRGSSLRVTGCPMPNAMAFLPVRGRLSGGVASMPMIVARGKDLGKRAHRAVALAGPPSKLDDDPSPCAARREPALGFGGLLGLVGRGDAQRDLALIHLLPQPVELVVLERVFAHERRREADVARRHAGKAAHRGESA